MTLSVVVLSRYEIISGGVAAVLDGFSDRVEVVASDAGDEAVDIAVWSSFGVQRSLDLNRMRLKHRASRLVVLCWDFEQGLVDRCLEAGASGYLGTSLSGEDLVSALERVHRGDVVVAPAPKASEHPAAALTQWPGEDHGLSEREGDIIGLITAGLSNDDIARHLFLSINTVKSYIRSAYRKMGVASRSQAVLWGVEHGFRRASRGAQDLV